MATPPARSSTASITSAENLCPEDAFSESIFSSVRITIAVPVGITFDPCGGVGVTPAVLKTSDSISLRGNSYRIPMLSLKASESAPVNFPE